MLMDQISATIEGVETRGFQIQKLQNTGGSTQPFMRFSFTARVEHTSDDQRTAELDVFLAEVERT